MEYFIGHYNLNDGFVNRAMRMHLTNCCSIPDVHNREFTLAWLWIEATGAKS